MRRWPVLNFALIGATCFTSGLIILRGANPLALALDGWRMPGLVGHIFTHADLIHLIGNMLFLWLFGNAICAKVGDFPYLVLYVLFGLGAASLHIHMDGALAVGASGAINGVVGMFLVLYPLNDINCVWALWLRVWGTVSLSSYWLILLWFVFDIWGAVTGGSTVAYWAHIGGFITGVAVAVALLKINVIEMTASERSLLEVLGSRS